MMQTAVRKERTKPRKQAVFDNGEEESPNNFENLVDIADGYGGGGDGGEGG